MNYTWICPICNARGYPPRKNSKPKTKLKAHSHGVKHIRKVHGLETEPIIIEDTR